MPAEPDANNDPTDASYPSPTPDPDDRLHYVARDRACSLMGLRRHQLVRLIAAGALRMRTVHEGRDGYRVCQQDIDAWLERRRLNREQIARQEAESHADAQPPPAEPMLPRISDPTPPQT